MNVINLTGHTINLSNELLETTLHPYGLEVRVAYRYETSEVALGYAVQDKSVRGVYLKKSDFQNPVELDLSDIASADYFVVSHHVLIAIISGAKFGIEEFDNHPEKFVIPDPVGAFRSDEGYVIGSRGFQRWSSVFNN